MIILNRNFELPKDGWFHVMPLGTFSHPSGVTQLLDAKASEAIVNRFKVEAASENFPGLLVDYDHFSDDGDKLSEAAGWVTDLQNRADGVWGQIRWSDSGEAAVKGGRYRLLSPVFNERDTEALQNAAAKKKTLRPLRLIKVALTNDPNLKGMVPLSNRASREEADVTTPNESKKTHMLKTVIALLGLSADASEETAIAEVTKLKNRASTLEGSNKELLDAQVESDLEKYKNRFKPEKRESIKGLLLSNRKSTIEMLEMMDGGAAQTPAAHAPLHNRSTAKTPKPLEGDDYDAQEVKARKIKNRASELKASAPGRDFDACWSQATQEVESQ